MTDLWTLQFKYCVFSFTTMNKNFFF